MQDLLHKIKVIRLAQNLKQSVVADQLNMKQSTYSQLEKGKVSLSVQRFLEISKILGIPPDVLLCKSVEELLPPG